MITKLKYLTRTQIERLDPDFKHGGWHNAMLKAKVRPSKKSISKGRLKYLYTQQEAKKILAAAKIDRRKAV